ncbi:energy transducer TonB [Flavobacterium caeni]|uniref:energy transducer TonB n=1 Tax=Flavobacterium caeni TaxID=490189 RepID=UPI000A444BA5|nr:TonB family protein [Flavobacterium caeni]
MKKIYLILFILFVQNAFSQNTTGEIVVEEEPVYRADQVDVKAEFPGGMSKFYEYLIKNFKRPEKRVPGKVFLSFVVESDGSIKKVRIVKNEVDAEFGNEAIRVLKMSPKWIPAEKDGKKVRSLFSIPINS